MVKDEKDLVIYRLKTRADVLEHFLEHAMLSIPSASSLDILRAFSNELSQREHMTFPRLPPEQSDLASAELNDELLYLRSFINSVVAKVLDSP